MALDRSLLLAFAPRRDGKFVVSSRQFGKPVTIDMGDMPSAPAGDWADYARGAVLALRSAGHELPRGLTALVDGYTDCGGLSSSAAAGVAYLLALEHANGIALSPMENVELDRRVENDFIGLNNGILDQSCILLSRERRLTVLDCRTGKSRLVPLAKGSDFVLIVLFSGLTMPLASTGYNRRVEECREAARLLLKEAGLAVPNAPVLRDVPRHVFDEQALSLPEELGRRARHYFTEQERVEKGVELWAGGDMAGVGRLVTESGRSSVFNYQCGNDYLHSAFEALCHAPGVYGARFSGAGFRGCCIALAQPGSEQTAGEQALGAYLARHPDMRGRAGVFFCRTADGAAVLE